MALRPFALLAAAGTTSAGVPNPEFDCKMRKLAYSYGQQLLPRKGTFETLYSALGLDVECDSSLIDVQNDVVQTPLPAGTLYVDPKSGSDGNAGSESAPFKTLQVALDKVTSHGTIALRGGTHFLDATIELGAKHSGIAMRAYPGEKPVVSGGKLVSVQWEPYNTTKAGGFEIERSTTAIWGEKPDGQTIRDYGKQSTLEKCEAMCGADDQCTGFTWQDNTVHGYEQDCWGRLDGKWPVRAQDGHASGLKMKPGVGIYRSNVKGQVSEVPGLQLDGVRATPARFPNLPAGIEVTLGYGNLIQGKSANWTAPQFDKFGPVKYYEDDSPANLRNITPNGWYQNYMIGTEGLCSVYDPPVSYWCSEHTRGGGAFAFRTPSGVAVDQKALPNSPYSDVSQMELNIWRPQRWANWMFRVDHYDHKTNNFTFGEGGNQGARGNNEGGDFFVQNVMEELDFPGEYFHNQSTGDLFLYYNGTGAPPKNMEVVVPQLQVLFNISGSQWNPVRDLTIDGITFKAASHTYMVPHGVPSGGDWALDRIGALFLQGTEGVVISNSIFERLDGNAVMISGYNRNATIQDSDFAYIGENAIASWGYTNETATSGFPYYTPNTNYPKAGIDGTDGNHPRYNQLLRNTAREIGLYEKQSSFYISAKTAQSTVIGNVFFNGPRAGINLNDGFGGGDEISNNLIFSTCRESGDHGPINSWDRQPYLTTVAHGTSSLDMSWRNIHHNFLIDNYSPQEDVDNDDGSQFYATHDNFLVYGGRGMKNDFGGHDNRHYGNIYAYVGLALAVTDTLEGHEDYFYENRVVLDPGHVDVGRPMCTGVKTIMGNNSYYTSTGKLTECGKSLADAQKDGMDQGSTVSSIPSDDAILGWARELLSMHAPTLMV